ncbi:MAG: choice-of-anchor D domain-containing protein, partial [Ignavibacteriales bacterium]|nr:choice-of-anchor D domain-containing protein [Ignavibacteriales bacterium]
IGCEFYVSFVTTIGVSLYDSTGSFKNSYPITIDTAGKTILFAIPLSDLSNDDGLMNIATNVGISGPDDHIPDIGHATLGTLWLSVFPNEGMVDPSGSLPVTARMITEKLDGGKFLANVVIGTNDPDKRIISIPVNLTVVGTPNLVVTDSIKFTTVFIGYSDTVNVVLTNNGSDVLTVSDITVNNARFTILGGTSFSIVKDASRIVRVVFTPDVPGIVNAQVSIASNDPGSPTTNVPVVASGAFVPVIAVSPDSLAFVVKEKDSTDAVLTISNSGLGPLTWNYGDEGAFATMVQILNGIDQKKNYWQEKSTISYSSSDRSAFSPRQSSQQFSSSSKILVIRNQFPWGIASLDTVLARLDIVPTIINSSSISSTNFSQYELVIVSSQQPYSFYSTISSQMYKFAEYVQNGGKLEFHYCPYSFDFVDLILPGGVTSINSTSSINLVTNALHPVTVGIPRVLLGNSAAHIQFANMPAGTSVITKDSATNAPTTLEYSYGSGRILLTGMTWEFYYNTTGTSEPIGKMLTNAVTYMSSSLSSQFISFIPSSGAIPAGGNQNVTVRANARTVSPGSYEAKIAVRNNDPAHNPVLIPVSMKVTGKPVISFNRDSVLFGIAHIGIKRIDTVIVKNIGSELLQVNSVSVSDTLLHLNKTSFSLPSGDATALVLSFTAQDTGLFSANLTISSNDSNMLVKNIPVRGKFNYPSIISLSPDSFMVSVDEGDSTDKTLTIHNTGLGELIWQIPQPSPSSAAIVNSELTLKKRTDSERALIQRKYSQQSGSNSGTPNVGIYSLSALLNGTGTKKVIVWSAYCDKTPGGELENTLNAIKEFVTAVAFDTISTTSPSILASKLATADVFLMPEQELINDLFSLGTTLSSTLTHFVQNGGTIVFLDHINRGSTTYSHNLNAAEFTAVVHDAESPLVKDVPATFLAMNGSNYHQSPDGKKIIREQFSNNNIVTQRDLGPGRIIYIGMDFYSYNSAMARLLANSVISSQGRNFVRTQPVSGVVAPGSSQPVTVQFNGKDLHAGDYVTSLNIENNDPLRNPKKVPVYLHVIGKPIIALEPDSVMDIASFVGIPHYDTLRVKNLGSDQLIVTAVNIPDTLLKVDKNGFTVAPGAEQKLLFTYTANDSGTFRTVATIQSNDSSHPAVKFILGGRTAFPPVIVVTPDSLKVAVKETDSMSTTLKIENTGKGELHWSIGNIISASLKERKIESFAMVEQIVAQRHAQNMFRPAEQNEVKQYFSDQNSIRFGGPVSKTSIRSVGIDRAVANPWITRAEMKTSRGQHGVVAHPNGKIYVFGGYNNTSGVLSTLEIYDPGSDSWSYGAPLPDANRGMSFAIDNNGFIYSIGGIISASYRYNPLTDNWSTIASMPVPIWEGAAVKGYDGRIYVFGGERALTSVQIYNPASNSWTTGSPMPTGRCQLGAVEGPGGFIYAIGGGPDGTGNTNVAYGTVEVYDPKTNSWSTSMPMTTPRRQFGACYSPDGMIYTIGGKTRYGNNEFPFFDAVEKYDPLTNTWSKADSLPLALGELRAAVSGGFIHAIGGTNGDFTKYNLALR